jgi:transmembrane sensor
MKLSELEILIDKYLAGEASEEEKQQVDQWLDRPTADNSGLSPKKREELTQYFWRTIMANIDVPKTKAPRRGIVSLFRQTPKQYFLRIAAALLFLVMSAAVIKYMTGNNGWITPAYVSITAKEGSALRYTLPDGSTACLFPGSVIQLPDNYNQTDRRIKVSGRVFFDVQRNEAHPFFVEAGELQTHVLGTSFEVNTLSAEHAAVVVSTGKVAVSYKGRPLTELTTNKRLRIDVSQPDPVGKVDSVNAASICSWWTGDFYFDQTPLPEMLQAISQWYHIPVTIEGEQWNREKVTMRFETQLPIAEVMRLLAETLGNHYKMTGKQITIY